MKNIPFFFVNILKIQSSIENEQFFKAPVQIAERDQKLLKLIIPEGTLRHRECSLYTSSTIAKYSTEKIKRKK